MGNIAAQDFANQIPAWSIFTAGYLFRDAEHLKKVFQSDVGKEMTKLAEDQLGVHILGPVYFGVRQVGLKPDKKINTPADLAGIKLRMPGGDAWQFLGSALGANPTPMAYAEVYTGLQSGAIDGQDNPLPNVENMKFYEVMSQIALTSHLVGFDLLTVSSKAWNAMTPDQQAAFQAAADKVIDWNTEQHVKREGELVEVFKSKGLNIYTPDVDGIPRPRSEEVSRVRPRQELAARHGRARSTPSRPPDRHRPVEPRRWRTSLLTARRRDRARAPTIRIFRRAAVA